VTKTSIRIDQSVNGPVA